MTNYTYNSRDVSIIIGSIIVDGYADGDFLSVDADDDAFTVKVGAQGDVVRSATNKATATITITLLQSSKTNDELSALHNADRASADGSGTVSLAVVDGQGKTTLAAEKCWVQKAPTQGFGTEDGTRAWVLRANRLTGNIGGSNEF